MQQLMINIDVENLDDAVRFYEQALGLTPARRLGDSIREMTGAAAPIYLLEKPRDYRRHWTPVHLDFVVDDIEKAAARARAAGATQEGETATNVWGRLAMFADPFGNGFCLVQFLGRGYDEIVS